MSSVVAAREHLAQIPTRGHMELVVSPYFKIEAKVFVSLESIQ